MNELTALDPGGQARFEGTTNKAVKSVDINSNAAALNTSKSFTGNALLSAGVNTTAIVGTDGADNTKTNTYLISAQGTPSTSLSFDANGNMTSNGTNTFQWDAENRLLAVIYPGTNNRTEFEYDSLSRCVTETEITAGSTTSTKQFVWCGTERCEERDGSNAVAARFSGLGWQDSAGDHFYGPDHVNSKRAVTIQAGAVETEMAFDPYGRKTKLHGSLDSPFGFAGMYQHERSGLNLTMFRAYDSKLGRWLSRDPLEEQAGVNLYSYVGNDPLNAVDPLGLRYSEPGDPTEGTRPSGDELWVVGPLARGVLGASAAASEILAAMLGAPRLAPCKIPPKKIGDLPKSVRDLLPKIWADEVPVSALPKTTRDELAAIYSDAATRAAGSPQAALNQARADYLLGTGPNPGPNVRPFLGPSGKAPPLH